MDDNTVLHKGDVITVYGTKNDLDRMVKEGGRAISQSIKTDWVFHGIGLVVGLLIGLIVIRISNMPLTLGAGGEHFYQVYSLAGCIAAIRYVATCLWLHLNSSKI